MSRRNLTSNKRAFRKNPRSFIDKVTEAPIEITINDGVNPEYTILVDPSTSKITESSSVPGGVTVATRRTYTNIEGDYDIP